MIRDRKERAPGRAVDEVHAQTELQADVGGWHKALPARTSSKPATPSRRPALKLIGGLWHVRWVRKLIKYFGADDDSAINRPLQEEEEEEEEEEVFQGSINSAILNQSLLLIGQTASSNKAAVMALAEDVGHLAMAVAGQVEEYKDEIGADTELLEQISKLCLELEAVHSVLKVCAGPSTAFTDPNLNIYLDGQDLFKRRSFTWFTKSPRNEVFLQRLRRRIKHSIELFSLQSSLRLQKNLREAETLDATRKDRILKDGSREVLDDIKNGTREVPDEIRDGTGEVLEEIPRETVHRYRSQWSKFASGTTHSISTILQTAIVVGEASNIPYLKGLAGIILPVSISVQATEDNEADCIRLNKMVLELSSIAARQLEDNTDSDQFSLRIPSLSRAFTRILRSLNIYTKSSYTQRFLPNRIDNALLLDCERELQHCLDVFQIRTHITSAARKRKDIVDEAFEDQVSNLAQNDSSDDGSSEDNK
ncbi:hypothetical protein C8J57DRAFT_1519493 [Mycena rebaudengoi]|nr:hypothetical protein C8J57DRAFT_1519493 [Mycena rebaudengoi]